MLHTPYTNIKRKKYQKNSKKSEIWRYQAFFTKFHTGVDREPRFDIPKSQIFFQISRYFFEFNVRIGVWSTQVLQIHFPNFMN